MTESTLGRKLYRILGTICLVTTVSAEWSMIVENRQPPGAKFELVTLSVLAISIAGSWLLWKLPRDTGSTIYAALSTVITLIWSGWLLAAAVLGRLYALEGN